MRVVIIFHRLGPYHFARLRGAGRLLPVTVIETSGADETYAWDVITGADGFERVTLFQNADAQKLPAIKVASQLALLLDKIRPAVVVIPGWADSAALGALRWCIGNHIPAIFMSESTAWDESRKPWKEIIKQQVVGLGSAALIGGTAHKDYIVQLGMAAECVFRGYDAVDNAYFAQGVKEVRGQGAESRPLVSGRPSIPAGPYFLASNRFIAKKNLPRLMEAYSRYRELASKTVNGKRKVESAVQKSEVRPSISGLWPLVLLGEGALRPDLCRLISDLSLQHCVQLPGFKQYPELPTFYANAGAFIHASTTEQWGLVVNEAMASGLTVLVSNRCGCAQDLVQEGVNGFTFDPYDVEQLAQLMLRVWSMDRGVGAAKNGMEGVDHKAEVSRWLGAGSAPASGAVFRLLAEDPPGGCAPKLSTSNFQPATTLADMGSASQRIISNWSPERFGLGLKAAVEKALEVGPKHATLLQRLILKALLHR